MRTLCMPYMSISWHLKNYYNKSINVTRNHKYKVVLDVYQGRLQCMRSVEINFIIYSKFKICIYLRTIQYCIWSTPFKVSWNILCFFFFFLMMIYRGMLLRWKYYYFFVIIKWQNAIGPVLRTNGCLGLICTW